MRKALCYLISVIFLTMSIGFSIGIAYGGIYEIPPLNPADFTSPKDNIYFPRAIGTTYVYKAETEDEIELDKITITKKTKKILGVVCTVVRDVEWVYVEELDKWFKTEDTLDWYAWDNYGNVWYFGEATKAILYDDDWKYIGISTEGSWKAGVDGAKPGIVMLADPQPGISYRQEYYEGVAEDEGKVVRLNASVSTEYGDFEDCLETKEWTSLAPGEVEHKFYAPGVGLVFIDELKEKTVHWELIDIY